MLKNLASSLFTIVILTAACAPKNAPPPATAQAAPEPAPAPAAEQPAPAAQPAAQQPPPAAAPDRRAEAITILDELDGHLRECEAHKMKNVGKHAAAIHQAATRLADPVAQVPAAVPLQAELAKHAHKLEEAAKKNDHKDLHHHHHDLVDASRKLRAAL